MFNSFISMIVSLIMFLISVAFLTLLERKVLSLVGLRLGPNKVSFFGIFQAIGDAFKLMNKQINSLSNFTIYFYYLSSFLMIFCALFLWVLFILDPSLLELKFNTLIIMVILGFNSLNSIMLGWSTFSKYSLIGSIRTVSQLISYEAALYICFLFLCGLYSTFSLNEIFYFYPLFLFFFLPTVAMLWVPSILAELNRTPFDFSEGESELVSGFNTEFGSSSFTLLFLAEYSNILFLSFLSAFLFFFHINLLSIFMFLLSIIWVRSVVSRYRFDKLMILAWKFILPYLTLMFLCFILFFM